MKQLIWRYSKRKPLKFCDRVSKNQFGIHTYANSISSCNLFSMYIMSWCNQLFRTGASLNRQADKRKERKEYGQGLQSKLHLVMKELQCNPRHTPTMSVPRNHVLEAYFLPRVLYAGTFLDASPSTMKSDMQNTFLRLLHQYLCKSE